MISIIVPIYNSAATIKGCVDSIQAQIYGDWELILADNGSTDESLAIIKELACGDDRIRAIEVPQKGVSFARNAALDSAKGEYVCFIDSDDTVEPDYLETLYDASEADLAVCGYFVDNYDSNNQMLSSEKHIPTEVYWQLNESTAKLQKAFGAGYIHLCCNKLFRRSIIEENKLRFKQYPVNEDFIFTLEFLQYAKSIAIVDKALYHWIRIIGKVTGVKSIPDNLIAIYNESHLATRRFINDNSLADSIAYLSYGMLIYKYYEAIRTGRMSRKDAFCKIRELINNPLVKDAYKAYKPQTRGETVLYILMKAGLYRTHYFLSQKVLSSNR